MKTYEEQYFDGLNQILEQGVVCVSGRQSEGERVTRTKRKWGVSFTVDLQKEFPVLKAKHVAVKSAIREILWIMSKQSNNINDLIPHIWDKWADEDGSVGKSYGYQVARTVKHNHWIYPNQVKYVLDLLTKDPSSRHAVIDLWRCDELSEMNLCPCVYTSHFAIMDGKLNCMITQRSGDYLVGVPFNTTQYAFLTIAFARHLGVEPGILIHNISDAHVYERQYGNFDTGEQTESFKTLMRNYGKMCGEGNEADCEELYGLVNAKPELKITAEGTDFFNIGDYDFEVYSYSAGIHCFEDIKFEVEQ